MCLLVWRTLSLKEIVRALWFREVILQANEVECGKCFYSLTIIFESLNLQAAEIFSLHVQN